MESKRVLCAANGYEEKYYFNDRYDNLPEVVQEELRIICVLFTADIGGILYMEFDEVGHLTINVVVQSDDYNYDTIGSELKIKEIQRSKKQLLMELEEYYKAMGFD